MPTNLLQLTRADTLIITVGTRQVGWHSADGVVRCFGADGDRGNPRHIDELYQELDILRSYHEEGNTNSRWGVRDLGHRYYQYCQEWLGGDFSRVELLLDRQIIADSVTKGLKHVILWATDQPETVSWAHRRADTVWLAQLMKRKIETTWSHLKVDVLHPQVAANHTELIREELEGYILPIALDAAREQDNSPVLLIENKGAVPTIAEGLLICSAALVRQLQIINVIPIEPKSLYIQCQDKAWSAQTANQYELMSVSEYFWPLERTQIASAWKRGDFGTCKILLQTHQSRHKVLYQLADYLSIVTNWEIDKFFRKNSNFETGWLSSDALTKLASPELIANWRKQLINTRQDPVAQTWESIFLIRLQIYQENYTTAFMQFAQILERLLYLRCKAEKWRENQLIKIPENSSKTPQNYEPEFWELIEGWRQKERLNSQDKWYRLLTAIRQKRNRLVHQAEPITLLEMNDLWAKSDFSFTVTKEPDKIFEPFVNTLKKICSSQWQIPEKTLLDMLADWGLSILHQESALGIF